MADGRKQLAGITYAKKKCENKKANDYPNGRLALTLDDSRKTITMEPEVGAFLARIAKSISLVLIWMLINTLFGIRKGFFFLDEKISTGHIIFYAWFVSSLVLLLWYIIKIWKRAPVYDAKEDVWRNR